MRPGQEKISEQGRSPAGCGVDSVEELGSSFPRGVSDKQLAFVLKIQLQLIVKHPSKLGSVYSPFKLRGHVLAHRDVRPHHPCSLLVRFPRTL